MKRVAWEKTNPEDFRIATRLRKDGYMLKDIARVLKVDRRTLSRALNPEQRKSNTEYQRRRRAAQAPELRPSTVRTWVEHDDFNPKSSY